MQDSDIRLHLFNQTNLRNSRTMRPLFSIPFFSILFSLTIFADKESLISFFPEDTFMVVEVDNWEELRQDLESGPWHEIQEFPIWQKVSDKIESEMWRGQNKKAKSKIFEAKESVLEPLLDSLDGGIVLGISNFISLLEREVINLEDGTTKSVQEMPFFAFIAESSLSQSDFGDIISSLKDLAENVEIEDGKIGKAEVYWILQKSHLNLKEYDAKDAGVCLALEKGRLFILTGGKASVESVLRKSFEDGKTIEDNISYNDCFEEIGKGQGRMFFNFKDGIRAILESESKKMKIPQNPFGVERNGLIKGMGLDGLSHLGVQLNAKSKGLEIASSLGLEHRKGILSFLAPVKGNLENHAFVSKDVITVSNARNDMGQLWPNLENTLKSISPALHLLVTSQIQAFEDKSEVAIRSDLFGSLGDEVVSLSYLNNDNDEVKNAASPSSSIYAIKLRDPKLFGRTMRAMIDSVSQGNELFEETEYKGVTIRSMRGLEATGLSIAYAITDDWLLVSMGKQQYLNQVINRMKKGKNSLWDSSFIENAMADLPRGIRQVDYVDFSKMFSFFEVMLGAIDQDEFDFLPEDFGDFPYFLLGWTKDTDGGLVSKAKFYPFSE